MLVAIPALAQPLARWSQAVLAGFDLAALLFLVSLWPLTRMAGAAEMRAQVRANDNNRLGVLVLTSLVMVVIVTAVTIELPDARRETGVAHVTALLLVLASLVIAWLFANIVFALHYAHLYYREDGEGGLNFPQAEGGEAPAPDYLDFVYFALTIGMAFATADIAMGGRRLRRTALVHAVAAFFYNLIVLAFTVNVTAGG
ncbi:MAG: DUF1345 domain-containing protein [Sphingomonadales bacterium]|nr:DUF1345 domain-containing protein [Sphingomonadales bacterium]